MLCLIVLTHLLLLNRSKIDRFPTVCVTANTGGNTSTVSYTFDAAGNKKTETTGSGTLTYDYDNDGRLMMTHFSAAGTDDTSATVIASQSYDRSGNVAEKVDYTAGSKIERTTFGYDLLNRLTDVVNMNAAGLVISSYHYALDAAGKRIAVTDLTGTTSYDYDNDGRLITESNALLGTVQYGYDAVGNRMSKSVNGAQVQAFQYDADDRVTNAYTTVGSTPVPYTYDNNGNLLSDGARTFAWDFENKMYASGVVGNSTPTANYTYNAAGLRVQLSTASGATNYTIDPDLGYGDVIEERDNTAQYNLITRYDYGDDIIRLDRSSGVYYYISDGLGSTRQLVDSTGAVQDSDTYDAFGNLAASSGSIPNWFLFNEQQLDPTGLYNLRARYMDPARGEFLGQDPFGGDAELTVTLHRYLYASNDPVTGQDPGGTEDIAEEVVAISESAALDSLYAGGLALARRFATNAIYGAVIGSAAGGWDAILSGGDPYEGLLSGAISGAAFGGLSSFRSLQFILQAIGVGLGAPASYDAFASGNYALGSYRAILTIAGAFGTKYFNTVESDGLQAKSLTNAQARSFYHSQLEAIPDQVDQSASWREKGIQAFYLRYLAILKTRSLMADTKAAANLRPPASLADLVGKAYKRGFVGDALWKSVYESSQRSNAGVDSRFQFGDAPFTFYTDDQGD